MHDQLIAALELAECELEGWATWHMLYTSADADKYRSAAAHIRAHIADLRAGNLVRREEVVAELRRRAAMPQPCPDCPRWEPNVSLNLAADAIAAGEHEEITNG